MKWPARLLIAVLMVSYAIAITQSYAPNPMYVLALRTYETTSKIHEMTLFDPEINATAVAIEDAAAEIQHLVKSNTTDSWEDLTEKIEPKLHLWSEAARDATGGDKSVQGFLQGIEQFSVSIKEYQWNESNPNMELRQLVGFVFFGLTPEKYAGQLPKEHELLSLRNISMFASGTRSMAEMFVKIRELNGQNQADLSLIIQLCGIDEYHKQTKRALREFVGDGEIPAVIVGMLGEFPSALFAFTNTLAGEYATKAYSANVTYTPLGQPVIGKPIKTNLTLGEFLLDSLFNGDHYWVHFIKMWLMGSLMEYTCGAYGLITYSLNSY